jgi:hypothetical protein
MLCSPLTLVASSRLPDTVSDAHGAEHSDVSVAALAGGPALPRVNHFNTTRASVLNDLRGLVVAPIGC